MHEALAAERHESVLGVAPGGQDAGPLAGPREVEQAHAGADHGAVGQAGDRWVEVAPGDGEHDLVEARQSLLGTSLLEQDLAHGEASEDLEVGVAQLAADERGAARELHRLLAPAGVEQPAGLDDVGQAGLDPAEVMLADELT